MSFGTILLITAITGLTVAYVSKPFWAPAPVGRKTFSAARSSLLAEKERILTALEELDFDFRLGKVLDEVYQLQRTELLQKGSEVLKALEDQDQAKKAILQEVLNDEGSQTEDKLEAMIAARKQKSAKKGKTSSAFCTSCGTKLQKGDVFCAKCGEKA